MALGLDAGAAGARGALRSPWGRGRGRRWRRRFGLAPGSRGLGSAARGLGLSLLLLLLFLLLLLLGDFFFMEFLHNLEVRQVDRYERTLHSSYMNS